MEQKKLKHSVCTSGMCPACEEAWKKRKESKREIEQNNEDFYGKCNPSGDKYKQSVSMGI